MQATETLIRAHLDALNRGDLDALLRNLTDDVVHDTHEGVREIGKDPYRRYLVHLAAHYRLAVRDVAVMVGEGRGAAEFTVVGAYLCTDGGLPPARGQEFEIPAGAFFEVAGEKIRRVTIYYNLRAWLESVS